MFAYMNQRALGTPPRMARISLALFWLLAAAPAVAEDNEITLNYGKYLGAPYVEMDSDDRLRGGLIKIVGEELASALGLHPRFILTPRNRSVAMLASGEVDIILLSNPGWLADSDRFVWTQPLFTESEVVVALASTQMKTLDDLKGKRIGTTLGFKYFGPIGDMLNRGLLQREDAPSVSNSLQMMKSGRVDCVIGKLPVITALAPGIFGAQALSILKPDNVENNIMAAISPAAPVDPQAIKAKIEEIFRRPDIQARILAPNF